MRPASELFGPILTLPSPSSLALGKLLNLSLSVPSSPPLRILCVKMLLPQASNTQGSSFLGVQMHSPKDYSGFL